MASQCVDGRDEDVLLIGTNPNIAIIRHNVHLLFSHYSIAMPAGSPQAALFAGTH